MKLKTLRANLFFYQVLLISIIILVAGVLSYIYISRTFVKMILIEQESVGTSLAKSLENELDMMNIVSMNICYSNLIKDMFRDYQKLNNSSNLTDSRVKKYNDQTLLFDSILGIMGPFHNVSQVNLYNFDGFVVGSGLYNDERIIDLSKEQNITNAIELDGYKFLTIPKKNELLAKNNMQMKNVYFLSLLRVFKDKHHQNEGIVEVLQDCSKIFSSLELQENSKKSLRFFLLNKNKDILYPFKGDIVLKNKVLAGLINLENKKNSINYIIFEGYNEKEIVSIFYIEKYELSLIFLQSKYDILAPLRRFQVIFFIFLMFLIIYTVVVSYTVSAKVTLPLDRLVKFLSNIKLNNFSLEENEKFKPDNNTFEEIGTLYSAFSRMSGKLKTSLNELIELKDQEALTRLLTLQSQMNPHFLYNNLANLSVLAEENKNTQVVAMCRDISFMLRYSTKKSPGGANIKEEMEYVEKYLKCMILRYEDDLNYTISYNKTMEDIRIPRILIQPLVENSINHGFITEPPWNISISGKVENGKWYVTVEDNGIGFPDKVLETFNVKTHNRSIHSRHLGLDNTKQRLNLIYKGNAMFSLENRVGGGARITIGGNINYYEDRYEG